MRKHKPNRPCPPQAAFGHGVHHSIRSPRSAVCADNSLRMQATKDFCTFLILPRPGTGARPTFLDSVFSVAVGVVWEVAHQGVVGVRGPGTQAFHFSGCV